MRKREFYDWLKSKGFFANTIQCYKKAIWLWEDFSNKNDFGSFNKTKAGEFIDWLKNKNKINSQNKVSISYCYDNIRHLKTFFDWLSKQPNYKSKINQTAVDFLTLSKKEVREARQSKSVKFPTLEMIKQVIENLKGKTEIEMRDRALFALAFLTGARISAIRTLPMESFDRKELVLNQDPALKVQTKFSKKITSVLVPFGYKESINYFVEWFDYLQVKGFKSNEPIFPATKIENGKDNISYYSTGEVSTNFFKDSGSLRKIFEKRFKQAGLEYYHPHTFRHSWVKEMTKLPLTEEEKKAISQNLGHEDVATTFSNYGSYGKMDESRQIELMRTIDFEGRKREVKQFISIDEARQLLKEQENDKST